MLKYFAFLVLLAPLSGVLSCQSSTPTQTNPAAVTPNAGARTEAEARAAVARYVSQQPNAALYQLDSARVVEVDANWQILVPRTDWAGRMPDAAAFDVDKKTGSVTSLLVK